MSLHKVYSQLYISYTNTDVRAEYYYVFKCRSENTGGKFSRRKRPETVTDIDKAEQK